MLPPPTFFPSKKDLKSTEAQATWRMTADLHSASKMRVRSLLLHCRLGVPINRNVTTQVFLGEQPATTALHHPHISRLFVGRHPLEGFLIGVFKRRQQ